MPSLLKSAENLKSGFLLGEWAVYPLSGELRGDTGSRRVQPKSMDVLLCLVQKAPDVLERDELILAVWGNPGISDEPLTRCIGELRRNLGDDRGNPRYIETIPKRGYRLLVAGEPLGSSAAAVNRAEPAATDSTISNRSLAVLPFRILGQQKDAYFAEGIADEILAMLSTVSDLRLAARTSTFKLRDEDHQTIRNTLGVRYILDGSVQRDGKHIRVNVGLTDTNDGYQVWARTFEESGRNSLRIQHTIAETVLDYLPASLIKRPRPDWSNSVPPSLEVHELYLKGLHAFNNRELEAATSYLGRVCEISPGFVPAHAALAASLVIAPAYYLPLSRKGLEDAGSAVRRALDIDPHNALAISAYGMLLMIRYDWEAAEEQFLLALEVNPRNPVARHWYGILLALTVRLEDSILQLEMGRSLDPLSPAITRDLGLAYYLAGDMESADSWFIRARKLAREAPVQVAMYYTMMLLEQQRFEEAEALMHEDEMLRHLSRSDISKLVRAVATYRETGKPGILPGNLEQRILSPGLTARFYLLAGHLDRGLASLSRAFQSFDLLAHIAHLDPAAAELRETREGKALLEAVRAGSATKSG
jgi:TolB-like protein/Tfp pilus assembly protein PilF